LRDRAHGQSHRDPKHMNQSIQSNKCASSPACRGRILVEGEPARQQEEQHRHVGDRRHEIAEQFAPPDHDARDRNPGPSTARPRGAGAASLTGCWCDRLGGGCTHVGWSSWSSSLTFLAGRQGFFASSFAPSQFILSSGPRHSGRLRLRLLCGHLHEELFQRRVLQANLSQRPAVARDRAGDLLSDVMAIARGGVRRSCNSGRHRPRVRSRPAGTPLSARGRSPRPSPGRGTRTSTRACMRRLARSSSGSALRDHAPGPR